mgnify:CR=1 FL=1
MSGTLVFQHAKKLMDAIQCLRDEGHHIASLMIVYSAIDQMAWLSIAGEKSNSTDFKMWVDRYMLGKNPIGCNSDELWEARNGLLHMGTAESAAHLAGKVKNRIYYTTGSVRCLENHSNNSIFIRIEDILASFLAGVLWFITEIEVDAVRLDVANGKIQRVFDVRIY